MKWFPLQKMDAPDNLHGEVWWNPTYGVIKRFVGNGALGPLWHLSIRRVDRKPIRDWRDLQRIKNELVGPESEGIELFPAESRLVDGANQYHLWVFESYKFPFGFDERLVSEMSFNGAVQRPFDEKPPDLVTDAQELRRRVDALKEK